jgi:ABC-2 type transport system ATP-binding protein
MASRGRRREIFRNRAAAVWGVAGFARFTRLILPQRNARPKQIQAAPGLGWRRPRRPAGNLSGFTFPEGAGYTFPRQPFATRHAFQRMVQVEGLTKLYGEFVAVNDLSFSLQPGEVVGLVGPNGAGKTTTLRCLAGIIPPARGTIKVAGHDLAREPLAAKQQLAFFTDEPRLFDYLTVWQHLNFVARIYQVAGYETVGAELLAELELAGKRDALPGELSRGMKQKLAIACGLLHSPRVIYFDEPLTGLDPLGIRRMKDSILKRARAGAAIMISSHLLHLVQEICSRILILQNGRKIADGTLAEVTRKFAGQTGDANLEEIFFRATGENQAASPPSGQPVETQ